MKTLNNTVIKNLNPEMGRRIIQKYKDDGWDTHLLDGTSTESNGDYYIYYGVINGKFDSYTLGDVEYSKARIIELDEWQPVRGERVLVWYDSPSRTYERIYLATIEGAKNPIVTVYDEDESKFKKGEPFSLEAYKHMKRIETNTELQELEAKYRELGEKIEQLKKK